MSLTPSFATPSFAKSPLARAIMLSVLATGLTANTSLVAGETEMVPGLEIEEVITVGTRVPGRTATETPVPVDVINSDAIGRTGATETGALLQKLAPSFNFSRTTVSDGTDIVRPATLRGLGPDQVLVLVNGKRRHSQAQINIQQTVGRGSSGTDINSIPTSAIERIEVLRDGAAAQYGSDAIAGVINIILKSQTETTDVGAYVGQTSENDGDTLTLNANTGFDIGDGGYINVTAEVRDRDATNRAHGDNRFEDERVSMRIGDADSENEYLFVNAMLPLGEGELYAFGGVSRREGVSGGFYRFADSSRNVNALFPNGFLPLQTTRVEDDSFSFGYRTQLIGDWNMDASFTYGRNEFENGTQQSVNVSLGADSPTSADNGAIIFEQKTFNLDITGELSVGLPDTLYVAGGFEYRDESYEINEGDFHSYAYGPNDDFSVPIYAPDAPTELAPAGMQAYPGFRPEVTTSESRDNYALYLDAETSLTDALLVGAAVRYEDYSDVGPNTTGKLSFRWDVLDDFALRGAISTGFRAPGLNQRAFTSLFTNLGPNGLAQTLHAPEGSDVALALGVDELKEETSFNTSLGFVWNWEELTLTVDAYYAEIDDRIVLSGNIVPEGGDCSVIGSCPIREALDPLGYAQTQFFTNAIDTKTTGVDLVADYGLELDSWGSLVITGVVHYNRTTVENINAPDGIAEHMIFDEAQVDLTETGQPRQRFSLSFAWNKENWDANLRFNRYGKIKTSYFTESLTGDVPIDVDGDGSDDFVDTARNVGGVWIADLDVSYNFDNGLRVTVGADNLFDEYPDKLKVAADGTPLTVPGLITGGSFSYPWEASPFGINGRFVYGRVNYSF
jgi:iron complex outermembrane receptor protein